MRVEVYESFLEARFWLDRNLHLIESKNCKEALCNFLAILQKLLSVYYKHADEKYEGVYCTKPNKYGSGEYAEYGNYNGYQKHNDLIWELTFELTKSANEICDIIRSDYGCDFTKEKVGLRCSTNIIEGYCNLVVEYGEGEIRKFDFESFLKDDSKRLWKDDE